MDQQPAGNLASPNQAAPQAQKGKSGRPFAVILEPSRELAEQTRDQISLFKKHLNNPKIRDTLLIGGVNAKDQLKDLAAGVEIVVGTPGRVEGFVEQGKLDLSNVSGARKEGLWFMVHFSGGEPFEVRRAFVAAAAVPLVLSTHTPRAQRR